MRKNILRAGVGAVGAAVLVVAGAVAASAEEEYGEGTVDVEVTIAEIDVPSALTLTIAGTSTSLVEDGSTATVRQFTGSLPEVTVTDNRTEDEIPDGANWYVLGSASDFVSATSTITADHLGWSPYLVDGSDEGDGVVSVGGDVETVIDGDRGLVDQELLAAAIDVPSVDGGGTWTASADLFLRVGSDVEPGDYTSVMTISLFE